MLAVSDGDSIDEIDHILELIFRGHKACHRKATENEDLEESVARYFYHHCFVTPKLKMLSAHGRPVNLDSFLSSVIFGYSRSAKNNIFHLLGDVGTGKSAFVDYLITTVLSGDDFAKKQWYIKLNAESLLQPHFNPDLNISKHLTEEFARRVVVAFRGDSRKRGDIDVKDLDSFQRLETQYSRLDKISESEIQDMIVEFCVTLKSRTDQHLLLILDNLDFIAHLDDRGQFLSEKEKINTSRVFELYAYCTAFLRNQRLGSLGANVLVVARPESHLLLSTVTTTSMPNPFQEPRNVFSIVASEPIDVYNSRVKLLAGVHVAAPSRERVRKLLINVLEQTFESEGDDTPCFRFENLKQLSSRGFRDLMHYARLLAHMAASDRIILSASSRPAGASHYPRIIFMLYRFCGFSQPTSKFPNLFLINGGAGGNPFSHRVTYWLKWLLMAFIESRARRLGTRKVSLDDIYTVFSGGAGRGYEKRLVQECLGSLSEADISNVLIAHKELTADGSRIRISAVELSNRGLYCLSDLAFDFSYLQLIVDDPLLPLPSSARAALKIEEMGYAYVFKKQLYREHAAVMLESKTRAVFLFLDILRCAFEHERKHYYAVFERLDNEGVRFPAFDKIVSQIESEIAEFRGSLELSFPSKPSKVGSTDKAGLFESTRTRNRDAFDGAERDIAAAFQSAFMLGAS